MEFIEKVIKNGLWHSTVKPELDANRDLKLLGKVRRYNINAKNTIM
jgi:hypothetical protein